MKNNSYSIKQIRVHLEPYKGILSFLFWLFLFWTAWKIAIDGDRDSEYMYLFGQNITPDWILVVCRGLVHIVSWFIHLFPGTDNLVTDFSSSHYFLYFPEGGIKIGIIWGCTGIKQLFVFSGVMACCFGPWKKKLWYIPLGCVVLTLYNIVRIGAIIMLTNGRPERFDSLHDGIFRYIYYTLIFLLWLGWEEWIAQKHRKHDSQRENSASA